LLELLNYFRNRDAKMLLRCFHLDQQNRVLLARFARLPIFFVNHAARRTVGGAPSKS